MPWKSRYAMISEAMMMSTVQKKRARSQSQCHLDNGIGKGQVKKGNEHIGNGVLIFTKKGTTKEQTKER